MRSNASKMTSPLPAPKRLRQAGGLWPRLSPERGEIILIKPVTMAELPETDTFNALFPVRRLDIFFFYVHTTVFTKMVGEKISLRCGVA
jgi:hypothetical protein